MNQPAYIIPSKESLDEFLNGIGVISKSGKYEVKTCLTYFPRRGLFRKGHYNIMANGHTLCHLIVGEDLHWLYDKAVLFAQFLPALACRPLGYQRRNEQNMDFLAIEAAEGQSLDDLVNSEKITATQWRSFVEELFHTLGTTQTPSTAISYEEEVESICRDLSILSDANEYDVRILQDIARRELLRGDRNHSFCRWSNGDVVGRNIYVSEKGKLRLIDYEFVSKTHFYAADGLRLTRFSMLPPGLDLGFLYSNSDQNHRLNEVYLHLSQLVFLGGAEKTIEVRRHLLEVVEHLCGFALENHNTMSGSVSGLLMDGLSEQCRSLRGELQERTTWARSLEKELFTCQQHYNDLQQKLGGDYFASHKNDGKKDDERKVIREKRIIEEAKNNSEVVLNENRHLQYLVGRQERDMSALAASLSKTLYLLNQNYEAGFAKLEFLTEPDRLLYVKKGKCHFSGFLKTAPSKRAMIRLNLPGYGVYQGECSSEKNDGEIREEIFPTECRFPFVLEAYLPMGLHQGEWEVSLDCGKSWLTAKHHWLYVERSKIIYHFDSPGKDLAKPGQEQLFQGWCFHPQETITSLSLRMGDVVLPIQYGFHRPDVEKAFAWSSEASRSGFWGLIPLPKTLRKLFLRVELFSGEIMEEAVYESPEEGNPELQELIYRDNLIRAESIAIPNPSDPLVTIIIPVYNQLELSIACLESIGKNSSAVKYEIVIVDDCSTEPVVEILSKVQNIRVLSQKQNSGFIASCQAGALLAKGKYLLFLNNDTVVTPGWVDALLEVYRYDVKAGAVGAKLLYPNGTLQEAGALLWEDGSAENYGKGQNPEFPKYNYLREADYCSGACLMIRRDVYENIGGFDDYFRPGYYEDADLCMQVREQGLRVYYQPRAVVFHHEGSTSGTSLASGMKSYQVVNQQKFLNKWSAGISGYGLDSYFAEAARDRYAFGRILVIDACGLTPDMDSGSLRMFNLLKILRMQVGKVTFLPANMEAREPHASILRQEGIEYVHSPYVTGVEEYLREYAYLYDIIIVSRYQIAENLVPMLKLYASHAKIIYDTVDLAHLRLAREAELTGSYDHIKKAEQIKNLEINLCAEADYVYVVSPEEEKILKQYHIRTPVSVITNIHEICRTKTNFEERSGILFVGGFAHPPNLDAIRYFLGQIWPLVLSRLPGVEFHIVGSQMPEEWSKRQLPGVVFHGYVPNMEPILSRVKLSVAPLRYGAGVKGKINQSMAAGVPVVATPIAAEGMHLQEGWDIMLGADPCSFAEAVVDLYQDQKLWERLAEAGLENIQKHFSVHAVSGEVFRSLQELIPNFHERKVELPSRRPPIVVPGHILQFSQSDREMPFLYGGWSGPEAGFRWSVGSRSRLRFKFELANCLTEIVFEVRPFLVEGICDQQRVLFKFSGSSQKHQFVLRGGVEKVSLPCPGNDVFQSGLICLEIEFPDAISPYSIGYSSDSRKLGVAFFKVEFH